MKPHYLLITLLLSGTAWAAEPAADTAPIAPAAESTAPATQAPPMEQAAPTEHQAAPAAEESTAQAADQSGFSRGSVVRSVFTTGVKDREPVDKLNNTKTDDSHIYFFTELRDMSGQTAIHRWEHNGQVEAEVKFNVRGPRWRVWSSKTFNPNATGEWKVSVLNGAGEVIAEDMMDYTGPAAPTAEQAPAAHDAPPMEQEPAQPASTESAPK